MAHRLYPHELRIHTPLDPAPAACRLARSGTFGKFVVYEREGTWAFAGGVAGEILLDHEGYQVRWRDDAYRLPFPEDPAATLSEILAAAPYDDWCLYGWTAFEYAYAQAAQVESAGTGRLQHLLIPQVEIKVREDGAVLRGSDRRLLQVLADVVTEDTADPALAPPVSLPVEQYGGVEYRRQVASVVRDIQAKRLNKAIVSRAVSVDFDIDLVSTYLVGRAGNTPSRSFLLQLDGLGATGFSPETIAEVSSTGEVISHPLAGTRALHRDDPGLSEQLRADLLSDPKEVFEHAISVQLAHQELQRICEPGTVRVDDFMQVLERGSVQHLASTVGGRLGDGNGPWAAFAALFPAVTASGIPKPAAYQTIRAYEPQSRGLYSGSVLTADASGSLDAALVLRTVFQRGGRTWLQAGAGIVADSTPDREFEETCEKLRSVARFLVPAEPAAAATATSRADGVRERTRG